MVFWAAVLYLVGDAPLALVSMMSILVRLTALAILAVLLEGDKAALFLVGDFAIVVAFT